jgi:hypothetical protein
MATAMIRAALATTGNEARPLIISGRLWRATVVVGDGLLTAAIVLCIPFVILAIGLPIALGVRLLLWIVG